MDPGKMRGSHQSGRANADASDHGVAALVQRFGLSASAATSLQALVALVERDALAPTTLRAHQEVLDDHLADSLVALELDAVREARALVDIGAGAGFPGLPLAVALPRAEVSLVESSGRKAAF